MSSYSSFIQTPLPISYQYNFLLQVSHSGCLIEIKSSNKKCPILQSFGYFQPSLMFVIFIHVIGCISSLPFSMARN